MFRSNKKTFQLKHYTRLIKILLCIFVLSLFIPSELFALESWPLTGDWSPMLTNEWLFYEDANDVSQSYIDLVTDANGTVGYHWSSTTSLFFRMSLESTPVRKQGDLYQFAWSVALDVDNDNFLDWFIQLGGVSEMLWTYPNSITYPDNNPDATAYWSVSDPLQTSGHVRVVPAPSAQYPDAVYLDIQVPYSAVQMPGFASNVYYNNSYKIIYGTGTNESANLTEIMGSATTIDQALATATSYSPSHPDAYGEIYDDRDTAPYSNAGIWYRNETLTVTGSGWPSSLSIYFNGGQRNVRILDELNSVVWSGVMTTTSAGDLLNYPLWTIGLAIIPGIYTIQVEDARSPGNYYSYDSYEVQSPVMSVSKITTTPDVASGATVNYSIRIRNNGNITGVLTSITDNLPSGFSYLNGTVSGLTTADPTVNGDQLTWSGSWTILPSDSVILNFSATAALIRGSYLNNVTISGDNFPVISTGPTATVLVTGPTLTLNKSVDKSSAAPGDTVTYTVTYSNTGDGNASFVFILESIPDNTDYITDSAAGAGMTILYSHNGGISYDGDQTPPVTNLSYQLSGTLAPGASGSVSFQVIVK